jgi:serine O-acetyltransferase
MFDNIREDLRTYGGQWSAQGLWVMIVYRFGRWRYRVRPAPLCSVCSIIYNVLYKVAQNPHRNRIAMRGEAWPQFHH